MSGNTLLPEMTHQGAGLVASALRDAGVSPLLPDEATALFAGVRAQVALVRELKERLDAILRDGQERKRAIAIFESGAKAIADTLPLFETFGTLVEHLNAASHDSKRLLQQAMEMQTSVQQISTGVETVLAWLKQEFQPFRLDELPTVPMHGPTEVPEGFTSADDVLREAQQW